MSLTPPWVKINLLRFDGCQTNDEIHLELQSFVKQKWVSLITHHTEDGKEWSFIDEGKILPWPLHTWKHHHRVISLDEKRSEIIDDINFECSPRWLNYFVYPVLWMTFSIRPRRYRLFFEV